MELDAARVVAGFAFSLLAGHLAVVRSLHLMRPYEGWKRSHTAAVGFVERTFYTASFVLGHPEFAAVWLAFKVAPELTGKSGDRRRDTRASFNLFLVGSGLSFAFGVAGGIFAASAPSSESSLNAWPAAIPIGLWLLIVVSYNPVPERLEPVRRWLQGRRTA